MASSPSSSSSSSPFPSPSLPLPRSPLFTPIPELDKEEEDEVDDITTTPQHQEQQQPSSSTTPNYKHHPTPLHSSASASASASTSTSTTTTKHHHQRHPPNNSNDRSVNCNKCRPSSREKISIVPLDTHGRPSSLPSPNTNILKSLFSSITGKSPRPSSATSEPSERERSDEWKLAAAELSRKLLHATRKRDEAVLEASRLKDSMSELEKKLTKLESHCHDLKSSLDRCTAVVPRPAVVPVEPSFPLDAFLRAVSEARTMVRHLSRSLAAQIRQSGPGKTLDRIALLLHPYDLRVPAAAACKSGSPRSLLFYLEALLSRIFYDDFESAGFTRSSSDRILDPFTRSESNRAAYEALKRLTWEEVLSKGTRHYSEELSRFCDRKMSEVVGMLGWDRAWPEPLLQAFFGVAKGVWLVHLLAWSVHPAVPLFRVDKGSRFDPGYMEDVAVDRVRKPASGPVCSVRMMLAPGFYVYSSVIKCKVL